MKKELTGYGLTLLIMATILFTAFTQQEKNRNQPKKEQRAGQDKQGQGKKDQPPGQDKNKENKGKDVDVNKGRSIDQGNKGQGQPGNKPADVNDRGKSDEKNKGRDDNRPGYGKDEAGYGYDWNRETFRDRDKIRKQDKVTICHKFNNSDEPAVTIRVSANALQAHLNHGDVRGDCPQVSDSRYSDRYWREREDYYNTLQQNREQVVYSRSILGYALARLADARLQLNQYRNSGMPAADIERKQVVVLELERNVSLLDALIATAATVAANKLLY